MGLVAQGGYDLRTCRDYGGVDKRLTLIDEGADVCGC